MAPMRVCLLPVQRQLHRPARIDRHERKTPRGAWLGGVIVQSETGLLQLLAETEGFEPSIQVYARMLP